MAYLLTRADFLAEAEPHRDHMPTRPLSPPELEELIEPELRYKPESEDVEPAPAHSNAPRRTRRMRVFDFKPLVRPS